MVKYNIAVQVKRPDFCERVLSTIEKSKRFMVHDGLDFSDAHALIMDIGDDSNHGVDLMKRLRENHPELPAITLTQKISPEESQQFMRNGAASYLGPEWTPHFLKGTIDKVIQVYHRDERGFPKREHVLAVGDIDIPEDIPYDIVRAPDANAARDLLFSRQFSAALTTTHPENWDSEITTFPEQLHRLNPYMKIILVSDTKPKKESHMAEVVHRTVNPKGSPEVLSEVIEGTVDDWNKSVRSSLDPTRSRVYCVVGPRGVGKSTLVDLASSTLPFVDSIPRFTTRPPKEGEVQFDEHIFNEEAYLVSASEKFIASYTLDNHLYGIDREMVSKSLGAGKDVIIPIRSTGVIDQILKSFDSVQFIYVTAGSEDEIARRLKERPASLGEIIDSDDLSDYKKFFLRNPPWMILENKRISDDIPLKPSDRRYEGRLSPESLSVLEDLSKKVQNALLVNRFGTYN